MNSHAIEHKITLDGSSTLYAPQYNQHYHSVHGALNESMHVFIQAGLKAVPPEVSELHILEVGFGTGLNALLTYYHAGDRPCYYTGIDTTPVPLEVCRSLNYPQLLGKDDAPTVYERLCAAPWNEQVKLHERFFLHKQQCRLQDFESSTTYNLIYFDAFAPNAQPELWTTEIFSRLFRMCVPGAILTTYSAKGDVRRSLMAAGFEVEKLPGPPGKREMLRARVP